MGSVFIFLQITVKAGLAKSGLPDDHVNSFTISGKNFFAGTFGEGVFHTTNNGDNWTAVNNGLSIFHNIFS